jgi:hypothetical protein
MQEVLMAKPKFFRLETIPTPELRDGFALDTLVLEEEMMQNNNGVDLSTINDRTPIDEDLCRRFMPYFSDSVGRATEDQILAIANQYPHIKSPCSMIIDSIEDLTHHMSAAYQVAHFHYILGKKHNLHGCFPHWCCGRSSRSLALSLIDFGYPNATYAYSNRYDHGYTILPFILGNDEVSGSVLIDPTYDQMWDNPTSRNAVILKLGPRWEYKTDWAHGANLFPDRLCTIDIFRKIPHDITDDDSYHQGGERCLNEAFANPIDLKTTRPMRRIRL